MPKRIKQEKGLRAISELADYLGDASTRGHGDTLLPSKEQISILMAELGRRGGKIGGKRRLETMTAKERSAIARKAAQARWEREGV